MRAAETVVGGGENGGAGADVIGGVDNGHGGRGVQPIADGVAAALVDDVVQAGEVEDSCAVAEIAGVQAGRCSSGDG